MEMIKRKMETTVEYLGIFNAIPQYSYNSDGHLAIRIVETRANEDILIVFTRAQTDDLFRFIKRINGVKD